MREEKMLYVIPENDGFNYKVVDDGEISLKEFLKTNRPKKFGLLVEFENLIETIRSINPIPKMDGDYVSIIIPHWDKVTNPEITDLVKAAGRILHNKKCFSWVEIFDSAGKYIIY